MMSNTKTTKQSPKPTKKNRTPSTSRRFEAETLALQSLRLIAAPNPKDDLTDDEIAKAVRRSEHSSELIAHLIEFIKTL
jgi:hypothetical protein